MVVWMFVDDYSSISSQVMAERWNENHPDGPKKDAVDIDYEEIENVFRKTFRGENIVFRRNMRPTELVGSAPDFYVFDIGGMDMGSSYYYSSGQRGVFSRYVANALNDHPDTIFVPWSSFTQSYAIGAVSDLILGVGDVDAEWRNDMAPKNIIFLEESCRSLALIDVQLMDRARELYQARGKK